MPRFEAAAAEALESAREEGAHLAPIDVVVDASRHIVSTTLTTIGGFIPLIVNGGKFWPPLATAIAGGVALALMETLADYGTVSYFAVSLFERTGKLAISRTLFGIFTSRSYPKGEQMFLEYYLGFPP